jgi:hypothetical protein
LAIKGGSATSVGKNGVIDHPLGKKWDVSATPMARMGMAIFFYWEDTWYIYGPRISLEKF